jgi:hypothetical protein
LRRPQARRVSADGGFIIDYQKYVESEVSYGGVATQTVFFGFDNNPRLSANGRSTKATRYDKVSEKTQKVFLERTKANQPSMVLINAWNEWGEGMHVEPGTNSGTKYLKMVRDTFR